MDSTLILKKKYDSGEIIDFSEASEYLTQSKLLNCLLEDFEFDVLNLLNRLTEIAEIPFAYKIPKVQDWVEKLVQLSYCGEGFSILGKRDDILSCYNAMITSILIQMHYHDKEKVESGINWILEYQNIERGTENKWNGTRILKYGGCMKSTPCYIGIVKAMIALSDYKNTSEFMTNEKVNSKLYRGLEYVLSHQVFLSQSDSKPVTKDITKLTYPFSYKTNIIEILRLLKQNDLLSDSRCEIAIGYLKKKQQKAGYWKINSSYLPKYWVQFDKTKEPGLWVTHEIEKLLNLQ